MDKEIGDDDNRWIMVGVESVERSGLRINARVSKKIDRERERE